MQQDALKCYTLYYINHGIHMFLLQILITIINAILKNPILQNVLTFTSPKLQNVMCFPTKSGLTPVTMRD